MEGSRLVTVQEAARFLAITEGAVRARIHRGTLETEREAGTVYVRIYDDNTPSDVPAQPSQNELVRTLREYNTALERQLDAERESSAELRRIIAGLVQRVPELEPANTEVPQEAPLEPREAAERAADPYPGAEGQQRATERPHAEEEPDERLSWWRRWFG